MLARSASPRLARPRPDSVDRSGEYAKVGVIRAPCAVGHGHALPTVRLADADNGPRRGCFIDAEPQVARAGQLEE